MRDGNDPGGLSWVQVLAGAGAAVSSALLLSTLGVAGTMVGAAVGSVAASLATHTYVRGLEASRERALAMRRLNEARDDLDRIASHPEGDAEPGLEHADKALGKVEASLKPRRLSWQHVALVAAGTFVGVMIGLTGFELLTGQAVSTYTGGSDDGTKTTVPGIDDKPKKQPTPTATPTSTPTPTPSITPSSTPSETVTPSETPTETPTATEPTPTPTPTLTPSETPTP